MQTRFLHPGFFENEVLAEVEPIARLLYMGLWCMADKEGRLDDVPVRIKKVALGYDDVSASDVGDMLQELHDKGFIIRYEVDGSKYIQIVNFTKFQIPCVSEPASEIPAPADYKAPSVQMTLDGFKEKKKRNKTKAEQFPHSDDEVPVFEMPLKGEGTYNVWNSTVLFFEDAFPNVNVFDEMKKMTAWLVSHPQKRKTEVGMTRFIHGWLQRSSSYRNTNYDDNMAYLRT